MKENQRKLGRYLCKKWYSLAIFTMVLMGASFCMFDTGTSALTTVPTKTNFQGRLTNSAGNIMADGLYNMKFRLFTVSSGGSAVWTETRETTNRVQVTNGLFSVKLGDVTPIPASLFASGSLYFEVELPTPGTATCSTAACASFTEGPMTPRNQLATSAYAYNSETLDGLDSVSFARTDANNLLTGSNTINVASANAFDVQNGSAVSVFKVDTSTSVVTIAANATLAAGKSLTLVGGTTGTRPASPTEGMVYFDTDTDKLLVYSNGKWQADRTSASKTVAPSTAAQYIKDSADYVADGTADQTEINAALTAAAGGKVYLFEGTFTTDNAISVPNDTTLAGSGNGTLIQFANIAGLSRSMIVNTDTTTGTGVTIRDLRLDGNKAVNTTGTHIGVNMNGVGNYTTDRRGAQVQNVIVQNFIYEGIRLNNNQQSSVLGSTANNNTNTGIVLVSTTHTTVSGNTASSNANHGISLNSSSSNNAITGNTANNNTTTGILLVSTTHTTVSGNTASSNANHGIALNASTNNTITGNVSTGNTLYGLVLTSSSNQNTVTSNTASNNSSSGILINGSSSQNTLSSNTASSNSVNGFALDSVTSNTLIGNTANSNTSIGIGLVTSSRNTLTGNTASSNLSTGIQLTSTSDDNVISANSLYDNAGSGAGSSIALNASSNNQVVSNRITDTAGTGFAINIVNSTSNTNYLAGNTYSGTGAASINDAGTGTIYGGQVNSAGNFMIQPSGTIELMKNTNITGTLNVSSDVDTNGSLTVGSADDQFVVSNLGVVTDGTWQGGEIQDAYISNTLTASILQGSGSTTNAVDLATAEVAGILAAGNGGTGLASYAIGDLLYASGATTLSKLAAIAAGSCLTSQGVATAPAWAACEDDTLASVTGRGGSTSSNVVFNGTVGVTTDATFTFAGTENLVINSDLAGGVNLLQITGTPSATAGTTRGVYVNQADSVNTNGLDTGVYINNADTDLAITTAIQINNTGGGGYTNLLDTPTFDISGTGIVTSQNSADSTAAFTISRAGSGGSLFVADTTNSRVQIGSATADATGVVLVLDTKNSAGDPTGVDGAMYYNSEKRSFRCFQNGVWRSCIGGLAYANTSPATTITGSGGTSDQTFSTSHTISAGSCQPGRVYRVTARGVFNSATIALGNPGTINFKVKIGSTTIGASPSIGMTNGQANRQWAVDFNITCITYSSTGSVEGQGGMRLFIGNATSPTIGEMSNTAVVGGINLTTAQTLSIAAQFSLANADNQVTLRQLVVEELGP